MSEPDKLEIWHIRLLGFLVALAWGFVPAAVVIGAVRVLQTIFPGANVALLLVTVAIPVCAILYTVGVWGKRQHAKKP